MSRPRNVRRVLGALVPVLSLAVGATFAGALPSTAAGQTAAAATSAVPPATKGATIDWFDAKYAAVAPGSVFETATLERFEYLLKKPGKFAFVIGGPEDATLQNALGHIDAVAKANGITKVYNFDPRLDGKDLDVFDPSRLKLSDAGKAFVGKYGTALVDNYLGKDAETPFTQAHTQDPYLFVYDGSGGDTNRITAALTAPVAAADLDTPAEVTAYREDVADVLTSAGTLGVDTQFDFLGGEHNRRHDVRYPDDAKFGGDIFDSSDATDGFRVQSVTYPELLHILQSPGDFALLFGGTWCHNTAAIIKATNKAAQQNGIKTVYAFDFVLNTNDPTASNGSGNLLHIRDNALVGAEAVNSRPSYLYGDLVNTYLSNAFTQYRKTGDPGTAGVNPVRYYPGGDPSGTLAEARKIQVGHLLTYNKDHKDAQGNPAPVLDQAIRKNADGTFTEYMTEWWYVQGQDLPRSDTTLIGNAPSASEANLNAMENQRAFAKEGIGRVRDVLAILGGGHASTVSATLSESVTPGVVTPVQVSVTAPDYSGFRSLNTANAGTAPASTVDKPTGRIEVREGATVLTSADLVDGAAAIDLPGLAAGSHSLTFHYSGSADGIVRESTATRRGDRRRNRRHRRRGCVDHHRQRPLDLARHGRHRHRLRRGDRCPAHRSGHPHRDGVRPHRAAERRQGGLHPAVVVGRRHADADGELRRRRVRANLGRHGHPRGRQGQGHVRQGHGEEEADDQEGRQGRRQGRRCRHRRRSHRQGARQAHLGQGHQEGPGHPGPRQGRRGAAQGDPRLVEAGCRLPR